MPPKRRSAGGVTGPAAAAKSRAGQTTLSFHGKPNKVTKPAAPSLGKDAKPSSTASAEKGAPLVAPKAARLSSGTTTDESSVDDSALASPVDIDVDEEEDRDQEDLARAEQDESEEEDEHDMSGLSIETTGTAGTTGSMGATVAEKALLEQARAEPREEIEAEAEKVSESRIKAYWREKEKARLAPRVHQEGLSVHEKVLREWDTSGQYGPCMGIPRIKRWKRAYKLNLNPPIEVLAVLLKEQESNNRRAQQAYIDVLMSSRFND
ncbi:DNA polymerase delta, subunit 4-domain-containing protein [Lineolata rhizophorae]|uniref:DNA polymerase delta, subunit 4-domain-containing protein n=1 Tax=Lineolata rhizophorae TaxID=578093 RepID=A0A6A6P6Z1_9PEZI|nr:DNA polymerase delta, subunit 4-domain-containing protein [Lineolata rhizophorae]